MFFFFFLQERAVEASSSDFGPSMGTVSPSSLCAHHEEESSIDELVMQQNLLFSESLKVLMLTFPSLHIISLQ